VTTVKSIADINRELGEQVLQDAKRDPKKYPDKYVGIANGKVVVVSNDLNETVEQMALVESNPANCYFVNTKYDYTKPYHIREYLRFVATPVS
jgi:uncharacterized protein YlzI (FlbEa/FlbD family)